jgi:hypothetical protein
MSTTPMHRRGRRSTTWLAGFRTARCSSWLPRGLDLAPHAVVGQVPPAARNRRPRAGRPCWHPGRCPSVRRCFRPGAGAAARAWRGGLAPGRAACCGPARAALARLDRPSRGRRARAAVRGRRRLLPRCGDTCRGRTAPPRPDRGAHHTPVRGRRWANSPMYRRAFAPNVGSNPDDGGARARGCERIHALLTRGDGTDAEGIETQCRAGR